MSRWSHNPCYSDYNVSSSYPTGRSDIISTKGATSPKSRSRQSEQSICLSHRTRRTPFYVMSSVGGRPRCWVTRTPYSICFGVSRASSQTDRSWTTCSHH